MSNKIYNVELNTTKYNQT